MTTFRVWLGALGALVLAIPAFATDEAFELALRAERERPWAARFERDAFLVRPAIADVTMSPDGKRFAFIRGVDDRRGLWLAAIDGTERQVLASTDATGIAWTRDGRWLLVVSARRLFAVAAAGQGGSRLLAELGGAEERAFMDADPARDAAAIVRERSLEAAGSTRSWRLVRIDNEGRRELLAETPDRIGGYALDGNGRLAFLQVMHDDRMVTWRLDADGARHEALHCEEMHRCGLWPRLDGEGRPWFASDIGGSLRRLQRLERDGTLSDMLADPRGEADLADLVADPSSGLPMLGVFRGTVAINRGIDRTTQAHIDAIERHYRGRAVTLQPGRSHWLVVERGGALQGARYHLYDPVGGHFSDILDDMPRRARDGGMAQWLPEPAMARQLPFSWTASDGMRLHGFVRVPPGLDPAGVPLVAMIHGGPWGQVAPEEFGTGYAQFLVNRGYAVFEPNFRGSTGFGRDYMLAAKGDFGNGRVQQDIVEGTQALLAAGVGDESRVGIVGASFGGYSTLLGLTWQSELFHVGVALVPPADFAWDLTWITRTREAQVLSAVLPFERWMSLVALDLGDRERMGSLHMQSPLANAARMNRPLTILAGGDDQRVALRGVLGYVARLTLLGKDVTLLVDPVAGHQNERAVAREAGMYLMAEALRGPFDGVAETPPDPTLREYLMDNLRVTGGHVASAAHGITTASSATPPALAKDGR
ncbi:dipeptidyl aminopeptidase/acylaminoacyl peptidase [Luteibacter jiangsuensis]|uniref:Dipeptidyl aminopeptidase/acylaminoacyl peptidase n=1 Tax=Luteibacter jiangsuensis TaxID=637577 RepID=A0ABT9SVU6_9GAMM|nr:prolyl oligopeptidase family serine peptidase [Luteibacter jiangsuensis]MDQ0009125.1 dipeptidyl aminopeptidase/acylaminoacyl peptidase [Luteibacter jiangsuensis]